MLAMLKKLKFALLCTSLCLTGATANAHQADSATTPSQQQASQNAQKQQLRIIAMAPHIVEMLYEIGAGEQIIGTVE